jgi:hypothetical protein
LKKLSLPLIIFTIYASAADPVSQKAIENCYNGYVSAKNNYQSAQVKDPYAPSQASGITLCRVILEHDNRDPAYDWSFQSLKDVIPDIDKLHRSLESKDGVCKIGGILYLKRFHRNEVEKGLKVIEKHCR